MNTQYMNFPYGTAIATGVFYNLRGGDAFSSKNIYITKFIM